MDDSNVNEAPAVVIDNGSGVCMAGFSGNDAPHVKIPNYIGYPRNPIVGSDLELSGKSRKDRYIGMDAYYNRALLADIQYPITHGVVTDWDAMQAMWTYILHSELRVAHGENDSLRAVFLTESPGAPRAQRAKSAEVLFEGLGAGKCHIHEAAPLAAYALGRTAGVVLDCGDGGTYAVPVYEGCVLRHAVRCWGFGGRDVTRLLGRMAGERGWAMEREEGVREVKELKCFVAEGEEEEEGGRDGAREERYELPDGRAIMIGDERFRAPEALFRPGLAGIEGPGVHNMVHQSITKCDIDLQRLLYNNVMIAGGNAMFHGFDARLKKELDALAPVGVDVRLVGRKTERKYNVWIGASMLASWSVFGKVGMWVTKREYEEFGEGVVHRKCAFEISVSQTDLQCV